MIKYIRLAIFFLFFVTPCFAEQYYVFVDKVGMVEKGREDGQTAKGDIVSIHKPQGSPSKGELQIYKIFKANLTEQQVIDLLERVEEGTGVFDPETSQEIMRVIKARKRKIDLDNVFIKNLDQEGVIQDVQKSFLLDAISVKPISIE